MQKAAGDSGHRPGKYKAAKGRKEKHGLKHLFNFPKSPD